MELKTQVVYVASILAFSLIASSEAVTCYDCNSALASGCSDPFKSAGIKTCTGTACTKTKVSGKGGSVVARACLDLPSPTPTNECKEASLAGAKGVLCTCTSNLCNSAKSIIPSAWLLAVVGVISMSAAIRN